VLINSIYKFLIKRGIQLDIKYKAILLMFKLQKYHKFNHTWLNVNFLWKDITLMIMDCDYMYLGQHFFLQHH
jgi:hypothetical protein